VTGITRRLGRVTPGLMAANAALSQFVMPPVRRAHATCANVEDADSRDLEHCHQEGKERQTAASEVSHGSGAT
jgi:hypothetical protein